VRTEIITCDGCGAQISVVHRSALAEGEFCYECVQKALAPTPDECSHEDNVSDEVPGRPTARKICKQCGYDRVEGAA
jgi:hypothetical protein